MHGEGYAGDTAGPGGGDISGNIRNQTFLVNSMIGHFPTGIPHLFIQALIKTYLHWKTPLGLQAEQCSFIDNTRVYTFHFIQDSTL